jgi:uncharacterized protein (TIRG00374 family)
VSSVFGRIFDISRQINPQTRRALLAGFGLLFITMFFWKSRSGMSTIPAVFQSANTNWIGVAVLSEVAALGLIVARSRLILARLGHHLSWPTLLVAFLRRKAVSAILPGGGAPAAVVFARDLKRVNVPADDAIYSIALSGFAGTLGTGAVLLPVLLIPLGLTGGRGMGVLSALLLCMLLGISVLTSFAMCQVNWIPRRIAARAPKRFSHFVESVRAHNVRLRDLVFPVQLAIASNAAGVFALYASLRAVHQVPSFATLMTTRAIGALSSRLAPVFQGSGLVESSMMGVLQNSGQSAEGALAATLLFRLIQVWIPVSIGLTLLPAHPWSFLRSSGGPFARVAAGMAAATLVLLPLIFLWERLEPNWGDRILLSSSLLAIIGTISVLGGWRRGRKRRVEIPQLILPG